MIKSPVKRIALDSMLLVIALMLSYLESFLPSVLPGFKLGLANIVIMFIFFNYGKLDSIIVSIMRVIIISLLFGNIPALWFSLAGAVFAYGMLWFTLLIKKYLSYIGISILCAAAHNTGQICAAATVFSNAAFFKYLPLLLIFSIITGVITGTILQIIGRYLPLKKLF